jgi:protein-tyrosine phosphatase family protein
MSEQLAGVIRLPDGTPLRGRGRREPLPTGPLPDYGLYLGRPPGRRGRLPRRRPAWCPDWPSDWVDWPDFRTPRDDRAAAALIEHTYRLARAGERVEVACVGGTGRTGTVIACMAVLAGHPAADALGWTRRNYRPRAVETRGQRRWIDWFATEYLARPDGDEDMAELAEGRVPRRPSSPDTELPEGGAG